MGKIVGTLRYLQSFQIYLLFVIYNYLPIYYLQFKTLLLSTHFFDVDYKTKHRIPVKSNRKKQEASINAHCS